MAATTSCSFCISARVVQPNKPVNSFCSRNFFRPISLSSPSNSTLTLSRSRICGSKAVTSIPSFRVFAVSERSPEEESDDSKTGTTINLKLPRRSLLIQFTCNDCGERTKRLINRLAYERGLVFVQCAGCLKYHKLVDNLGLVVEYDLREDIDFGSNTDEA